jgi:hypothetical protein
MSVIALWAIRKNHQKWLKSSFSRWGRQGSLISWVVSAWQLGEESRRSMAFRGLLHENQVSCKTGGELKQSSR